MKYSAVLFSSIALVTSAPGVVVASYDFDPDNVSGTTVDLDGSAQTNWTTTVLLDNATGIGALGADNQASANRGIRTGSTTNMLRVGANRESDAQTPLASGGDNESTWLSFAITPGAGITLDFSGNNATVDTYANHGAGLGGTVAADWTLYYSTNGGTSWTSLGTSAGAATTGASQDIGPVPLTWDLSPVGSQTGTVDFIIDPVSTGSTNGNLDQRGVSLDNLTINTDVIPESSAALLGMLGLASVLRRRR